MKKRIVCILLFFAMLIPLSVCAERAGAVELKPVYIPEKEISFAVPADYLILTRDNETLDPAFVSYGLTMEDVLEEMESQDIYLYAYSPDFSRMIKLAVSAENTYPTEGFDPEPFFTTMYDVIDGSLSERGVTVTKKEFYRTGDDLFFIVTGYVTEDPDSGRMQSMTILDGRAISIVAHSYFGAFTDEDEDLMKEILNASVLKKQGSPEAADAASETAGYLWCFHKGSN